MTGIEKVGFSYLWQGVVHGEPDQNLYATLKEIYRRLQDGNDPGVIVPHTINNIFSVIRSPHHGVHVKCVLYHIIKRLCASGPLLILFIKWDLLKFLHTTLEEWTQTPHVSEAESQLLEAQLALLETLTHIQTALFTDFIHLGMLRNLCQLCGPQCGATYAYGSQSYAQFQRLTVGVYPGLVGEAGPVNGDLRRETYRELLGERWEQLAVPGEVLSVKLYNTAGERDLDVAAEMRAGNGSWTLMERAVPMMRAAPDEDDVIERTWKDVYVTSMVDGCRFWAQVNGKESFQVVQEIDSVLEGFPDKRNLHEPPLVGTGVAVRDAVIGCFRGQVTAVRGDYADVHALDYGCVKTVLWQSEDVFQVVHEMGLSAYESQAVLCILKDVSPPPINPVVIQSLAAIIRNLAKESGRSFVAFGRPEVVRTLQYLCACPDPVIVRHAVQALANLAHVEFLRQVVVNQETLYVLMDKLQEYMCHMEDETVARTTYSILGAVTNILFHSPESREEFYMRKGLEKCMAMTRSNCPTQVQLAAKRALAVFVGSAVPTTVINSLQSRTTFPISKSTLDEVRQAIAALGLDMRGGPARGRTRASPGVTPDSQRSNSLPRATSDTDSKSVGHDSGPDEQKYGALSCDNIEQTDSETDDDLLSSLVGKKRRQPARAKSGGNTSEGELLDSLATPFTAKDESSIQGLDTATVYRNFSKKRAYIRDRKVEFTNDVAHDIRPFGTVNSISKRQILEALCGLLNTDEGGSVYIGLQLSGVVVGIQINRDQRDVLRNKVDHVVRDLIPGVPHSNYDVDYHQVVDRDKETNNYHPVRDLYVIEIKVIPTVDVVYRLNSGAVIRRVGSRSEHLSVQELYAQTVVEMEKRKLAEIETLEKELSIWSGKGT